ncbi:MAG: lasso peptide biosynthesis PqqD family chaperone [Actinomycetota bacterium]|nr:lasso peptide biosynthesis PqqD family chaperone [Actinomycetota bacterium]
MTFKLREGVSTAEVEYGTALLDEDRGQYWNLNPTGNLVLQTLLAGGTAEQAARQLAEQYAVDLDTASRDVHQLVEELCSAGLVESRPHPR